MYEQFAAYRTMIRNAVDDFLGKQLHKGGLLALLILSFSVFA
jgi:hypothetical protein